MNPAWLISSLLDKGGFSYGFGNPGCLKAFWLRLIEKASAGLWDTAGDKLCRLVPLQCKGISAFRAGGDMVTLEGYWGRGIASSSGNGAGGEVAHAVLTMVSLSLTDFIGLELSVSSLSTIWCHREIRLGRGGGEGEFTHFVEGDLYVLCLVVDLYGFLGHSHMPTRYLQMRDSVQEQSLCSTSWGVSPYVEVNWNRKKYMCLPNQTGGQTWQTTQMKERKSIPMVTSWRNQNHTS